jgi:hypothetical protein
MFDLLSQPVVATLLAGLVHFAIGAVWYSPAGFAGPWMRGLGITPADIAEARINMTAALGASALASLGQAAALAAIFAALGSPGWAGGAVLGAGTALAFGLLPMVKDRVWADRPWPVILVDGGYEIAAGAVAGAILGGLLAA